MDFCRKVIHRHHMTPHNFGGIFRELFKIAVVQTETYEEKKKLLKASLWQNFIMKIIYTVIKQVMNCFKMTIRAQNITAEYSIWRKETETKGSKNTKDLFVNQNFCS